MKVQKIFDELEKIRKTKNLSQNKFAEQELGIHRATYNRYLQGNTMPGGEMLETLTEYLEENRPKYLGKFPSTGSEIVMNKDGETLVLDRDGNCARLEDLNKAYIEIKDILENKSELEVPE